MNIRQFIEGVDIFARDFSQKSRKRLAKSGAALPGGGFPIVNRQDLKNAERAIGRARNPGAARAHIRKRAKALHVKLSKTWAAGPSIGNYEKSIENTETGYLNVRGSLVRLRADAPPGWKNSVDRMKEDHPEISNPYALAWYMDKKGDTPHPKKEK